MSTARSLWNGRWIVRDQSVTPDRSFAPAPADIDALPAAARPLVRAVLGAATRTASKARIDLTDHLGNAAHLRIKLRSDGTAEVTVTGATDPPPARLPQGLGVDESQLLDLTHDGLWVIGPDGDSGYVNPRMAAILGYEHGALLDRTFLSVVEDDDRGQVIALFDGHGGHRPSAHALTRTDVRLRRRNGSTVTTELTINRVADDRGATAAIVAVVSERTAVVGEPAPEPDITGWPAAESTGPAPVLAPITPAAPSTPLWAPPPDTARLEPPAIAAPGPVRREPLLPPARRAADAPPPRARVEGPAPVEVVAPAQPEATTPPASVGPTGPTPPAVPVGNEAYHAAFTHAPVGMAIIELDGSIREANPAMVLLLDPAGSAPQPLRLTDLVPAEEQDKLAGQLAALRSGTASTLRVEVPLHSSEEGAVWTLLSAAVVVGADGRPAYAVAQAEDITERRVAEHDLVHQTLHDPLTGLGNRLLLRDQLQQALSIANDVPFVVMFLDLDRFKSVNDTYGHDAGDALLVGVAQRLRRIVRAADTVARLGGDEFAIIAQGISDREGAAILAEKVRAALRAPFRVGDLDIAATASVGMVIGNREYATGDQLLRDADIAMYRAKDAGRDRHELFDDEIRLQEIERMETERTLHAALDHDGLKLHYQPIIDLHTGRAIGAEALLRIADSDQSLLTPDTFLGVAEDSRLILDVGAWVLREVCLQLARWTDAGFGHLAAWVNVSGLELASPRFSALVQRSLSAQRIDPSRLHLECTENVLLEASPSTIEHLRTLADVGISVGIDDFGTGYSSLSYLRDLPVSFLKIDSAFTRRLDEPGGASMVEAMVGLGRSLGLKIVAEGVESMTQMESLAVIGCDMAQGHLFASPGPIESIAVSDTEAPWK